MATPTRYIQGGVVPSRKQAGVIRSGIKDVFHGPALPSVGRAALDLLTIAVSALLAIRVSGAGLVGHSLGLGGSHLLDFGVHAVWLYMGWFGICLVFLMRSYGLYGPIQVCSGLEEQRLTIQATLAAGLLLCGALYLGHGEPGSRAVILLSIAFTAVLMCSQRAVLRRRAYSRCRKGLVTCNVLIVGAGRVASALRNHLDSLPHMGFRFKGFVALTEGEAESTSGDVIGHVRNCLVLARTLFVDEIFLSVPAEQAVVASLVGEARSAGIDVRVIPDLYDGLAWNSRVEYIGQFPTIPLHRRHLPAGAYLLKRALDITVAALGMLLVSPLLLLIAAAIYLTSGGPIFFRAQRIGWKGRSFACYKFRTMVRNAESMKGDLAHRNERDGILFKIANDPRITRVGRVLRKYSLDELPQLYNVLHGDMSLVGPRPPVAAEVEQYDLPHLRRLDVLPGITGLWQIQARQDPSFDSYISLDTAYVENWTLWLDLKILARTVLVVFSGTGS